MQQSERAKVFKALHIKSDPIVLFNVWDPGSAAIIANAEAKAIATGSWPVAAAFGFADGENIPLTLVTENLRRIVDAVDLPVISDIEGGYGVEPELVAKTVREVVQAGAVGFNFEDQIVGGEGLHAVGLQAARITAAREAADQVVSDVYINARTDIFLKAKPETHSDAMLDDALERAAAFAKAGGDGFFAPGLAGASLIKRLCVECPLPVNIIALPHVPDAATLADCGVARISHGPVPYRKMAAWLEEQARAAINYR